MYALRYKDIKALLTVGSHHCVWPPQSLSTFTLFVRSLVPVAFLPLLQFQITKWNDRAIDVELPPNYIYEVVETDPNFKGNTAQGGSKPAKINSGATVTVPMFIEVGEKIKVDTREATYVSRGES